MDSHIGPKLRFSGVVTGNIKETPAPTQSGRLGHGNFEIREENFSGRGRVSGPVGLNVISVIHSCAKSCNLHHEVVQTELVLQQEHSQLAQGITPPRRIWSRSGERIRRSPVPDL